MHKHEEVREELHVNYPIPGTSIQNPPVSQYEDTQDERAYVYVPTPAKRKPQFDKQWVKTPFAGPTVMKCYSCDHTEWVSYFDVLKECSECGDDRFRPLSEQERIDALAAMDE